MLWFGGSEGLRAAGIPEGEAKGSHVFMRRSGRRSISVPLHGSLARGTLRALIRDVGIAVEEFTRLL